MASNSPTPSQPHIDGARPPVASYPVAEILDLQGDGALINEQQLRRQPDWTFNDVDSGKSPADRIDERASGAD